MSAESLERILIVEDELPNREILEAWFSDKGYTVDSAENAEQALNLLEEQEYSALLTDNKLPGMSGIELLSNVRVSWPDTAVILMTAYSSISTAVEAMRLGAEDYIGKPFQLDELQFTVEKALERRRLRREVMELRIKTKEWGLLDRVAHEFRNPIVGIRSNASFLQRRIKELPDQVVEQKLNDILLDCEILLFQVRGLEYVLGRTSPPSKIEKIMVLRDVVIRTLNQLEPLISELGFEFSKIQYRKSDLTKIHIYVDRAKLNQVIYNLLLNSIKYAKDDPAEFSIKIMLGQTKDMFRIRFQDWGIGITKGHEQKIFETGFRTPEAISKNITGSGLGLSISRDIMRELGGDLVLGNSYKPTEFCIVLPKALQEAPHDPLHRR